VLAGGVDVAADVEAVLGGVVAGEAAGDFLLGFQGADAALADVVRWPDPGVRGEPVGAENLRHQAILMNHAPGAVTPLNPEMVQVGDAAGQRA
jgi:hypothetical protein